MQALAVLRWEARDPRSSTVACLGTMWQPEINSRRLTLQMPSQQQRERSTPRGDSLSIQLSDIGSYLLKLASAGGTQGKLQASQGICSVLFHLAENSFN